MAVLGALPVILGIWADLGALHENMALAGCALGLEPNSKATPGLSITDPVRG